MSMVLTRSPLEPIGMNGAGPSAPKRRSARLSAEGADENANGDGMGPPPKRSKVGTTTTSVGTKEGDGNGAMGGGARKKGRVYDQEVDDFVFSKSKKAKAKAAPAVRNSDTRKASPEPPSKPQQPAPAPSDDAAPKTGTKKVRRRLPTTPERDAADKNVRRSKRLSNENTSSDNHASPHKPAHARSHAKHERSPSPEKARPLTVEKKRKRGTDGVEEEKVMRIQLPFADTPVIKRNKEMRKASAEGANRRSSSGMRGRRASSLMDEGRGNGELQAKHSEELVQDRANAAPSTGLAETRRPDVERTRSNSESGSGSSGLSTPPPSDKIENQLQDAANRSLKGNSSANESSSLPALPHSEVPAAEFYKHISAELTENRRMRCLLGWCGTRTLPAKPEAPKEKTPASNDEFQALQAARVIQAELSQDLITNGTLSDWFSRDDDVAPQVPLRKKPNPRNVANAAKAEELERELERLKKERSEWDALIKSAARSTPAPETDPSGDLSPLHPDLLDSPQRAIFTQLQETSSSTAPTDPDATQQRMRIIATNLEFSVDQFAHGVHALTSTKETAERLAERSLSDAAGVLEEREKERKAGAGKGAVDAMDALRGLARVLNGSKR